MRHTSLRSAATLLVAIVAAACVESAPAASSTRAAPASSAPAAAPATVAGPALLDSVRRATSRFQDVSVALAEGYEQLHACITLSGVGAMGVHYINPALAGATTRDGRLHGTDARLDPMTPELLIYEPQRDGSMQLVAVEYYTSREAWGDRAAPSLFGVPFDLMQDDPATAADEAHGFTPHYDQHVWLYRENPAGTFAQWNAAVSCAAAAEVHDVAGH